MWMLMAVLGCGGSSSTESAPAPSAPAGKVAVSAEGTRFEPAVDKSAIPAGAWICDMGTVHYAALEGQGPCPVCGMQLLEHKEDGYP